MWVFYYTKLVFKSENVELSVCRTFKVQASFVLGLWHQTDCSPDQTINIPFSPGTETKLRVNEVFHVKS